MRRPCTADLCALLALCALTAACADAEEEEATPTTGNATLRFGVTTTIRTSPNLEDELRGAVRGAIFRAEEVSVTGPREGAESVDGLVLEVDLREVDESAETWTSVQLTEGMYIFLGFFDVDGNGADTEEPDHGDPVTLPISPFEVKVGETAEVVVFFDLVI